MKTFTYSARRSALVELVVQPVAGDLTAWRGVYLLTGAHPYLRRFAIRRAVDDARGVLGVAEERTRGAIEDRQGYVALSGRNIHE